VPQSCKTPALSLLSAALLDELPATARKLPLKLISCLHKTTKQNIYSSLCASTALAAFKREDLSPVHSSVHFSTTHIRSLSASFNSFIILSNALLLSSSLVNHLFIKCHCHTISFRFITFPLTSIITVPQQLLSFTYHVLSVSLSVDAFLLVFKSSPVKRILLFLHRWIASSWFLSVSLGLLFCTSAFFLCFPALLFFFVQLVAQRGLVICSRS
jgi:hypothetical protein